MSDAVFQLAGATAMFVVASAAIAQPTMFADVRGDASLHRTDGTQASIALPAGRNLPDIIGLNVTAWLPDKATVDPYTGHVPNGKELRDFVRIEVHFNGLLNPPGPMGGTGYYNPNEHGISPLYLFLDFDLDGDADTGGELGAEALGGYTANAGRFGSLPPGPLSERSALSGTSVDTDFNTSPQIERSGADWSLALCGCEPVTIVSRLAGDSDSIFETNEDWIISGRFFRRAGGYRNGSSVYGGSQLGSYDPVVNLRFRHVTGKPGDSAAGRTVVTLVYALTMAGAAQLRNGSMVGAPPPGGGGQKIDFDVSNDNSVEEGLADLVYGANSYSLKGPNFVLQHRWAGRKGVLYADPTKWRPTAIAATAYSDLRAMPYIYTDIAFGEVLGDVTGDSVSNADDRVAIANYVANFDGTYADADGVVNGSVKVSNFGPNFSAYDVNNDGRVDVNDQNHSAYAHSCPADINKDGQVDTADLVRFLGRFGTNTIPWDNGDINGDGTVNTADLTAFLSRFGQWC